MTRFSLPLVLTLLVIVSCSASTLPADHPCKTENQKRFDAECSAKIALAYEDSVAAGDKQTEACKAEARERCGK